MTIRIAMWSGPRNISTAMMRSWENRSDCSVVDEPFYAFYLDQTQSPHPMFEQVLASQSRQYEVVATQLSNGNVTTPVQYQKHMTHHMLNDSFDWAVDLKHCFLIRNPIEVVASYTESRGVCTAEEIGIIRQAEIYTLLTQLTGQKIPIIDSNDVLKSPDCMLRKLCKRLSVPFEQNMLQWPTGKRDSDGVWARHWYHSVEQSTGFAPFQDKAIHLNDWQQEVVEQVMPAYMALHEKRVR